VSLLVVDRRRDAFEYDVIARMFHVAGSGCIATLWQDARIPLRGTYGLSRHIQMMRGGGDLRHLKLHTDWD